MGDTTNRYYKVVAFRLVVAALALLVAARALHEIAGQGGSWPLVALLTVGASGSLLWPFVVPTIRGGARTFSPAHGFYLAGMFLVPPAYLLVIIVFSITLAGLLAGSRAYRTVFSLSSSTLVYAGIGLVLRLGPAPWDRFMQPASRAGLETVVMMAAIVAHLIVRSVALRIELGRDTPHWGAFQPPALLEAFLCLIMAVTTTLLGRVHILFLIPVLAQLAFMGWMVHRYRVSAAMGEGLGEVDQRSGVPEAAL